MDMTPIDPQGTLLGQDVSAYVIASWGISALLLAGIVAYALREYLQHRNNTDDKDIT